MDLRKWRTSGDGSIEYFSYNPKNQYGIFDVLHRSYYEHETFSRALELSKDLEAEEEVNEIIKQILQNGVSIVAVDKGTGNVVGVAVNEIIEEDPDFYDTVLKKCKEEKSRALLISMKKLEEAFDLFQYSGQDCWIEVVFLAVLPNYRNKRIAEDLINTTVELTQKLSSFENVKVSVDETELNLEPVPKFVSALFTSTISQRIGEKCGFEVISTILHKDLHLNGKPWVTKPEDINPSTLVTIKRI